MGWRLQDHQPVQELLEEVERPCEIGGGVAPRVAEVAPPVDNCRLFMQKQKKKQKKKGHTDVTRISPYMPPILS